MSSDNGNPRSRDDDLFHPGLLILVLLATGAAALILYYAIWQAGGLDVAVRVLMVMFGLAPLAVGIWVVYSTVRQLIAGRKR